MSEIRLVEIELTINGRRHRRRVAPQRLLVEFLRDDLGLTGTHVGCDTVQCGACTVLWNGRPVKSCNALAVEAAGAEIVTIEGLAPAQIETPDEASWHPMQRAFHEHHGLQCGFCTPGMVLAAIGIAKRHGDVLDEAIVRAELEGNLCRCTGYQNIVDAVLAGARAMNETSPGGGR